METYTLYPPQMQSTQVPYQVVAAGAVDCEHELLEDDWGDRISVQDGIVFIVFTCGRCGRKICQSLEEVLPPASWKGGNSNNKGISVKARPGPFALASLQVQKHVKQFDQQHHE